jgi:hypothetical protein
MNSSAVHEHVGTTILNNFSTNRKLPWDLGARAKTAFSSALSDAGFEVIDLTASGIAAKAADALAVPRDQAWHVNPLQAQTFEQLHTRHRLDAIIVAYSQRTLASTECYGGPCTDRYVLTSGLFTRGIFNLTSYYAVPAFDTKVFLLASPADLSAYDPIRRTTRAKVKLLRDMPEPKNLKNLSDDEFSPVVDWIATYVNRIAAASASALSGAGK